MTVLYGASVVVPGAVVADGWVSVTGSVIAAVGSGPVPAGAIPAGAIPAGAAPAGAARVDLGGGWLVPGFVDVHVHGGGGFDFGASPADLAAGVAFHAAHGTTRTLVSLVTAPIDLLCEQLRWVAALAEEGLVAGAHLEGPFLSRARCGAQHPDHLLAPDAQTLAVLLKAGQGWVRSVTVAPELPGGLDLVDRLVGEGVVAAVGHSDASYAQAAAAFERGASLLTHAFNGMRPLHHREPGPVPAALDAGAFLEVINDRVHVHPAVLRLLPAERLVLITDAIDAAGRGDGRYRLGGQDVVVADGQARLAAGGALAGSTLTMDAALRAAVRDLGLPIEAAVAAAATHPAKALGLDGRCGAIAPGLDADLVHLDADLNVTAVMARGAWLTPPSRADQGETYAG